jgi:hypothetical protein
MNKPQSNSIQSALIDMEAFRDELASGKTSIDDVTEKITRSAVVHKQLQDNLRSATEIIDHASASTSRASS